MGKKQKLKKERAAQKQNPKAHRPAGRSAWAGWLIGIVVTIGVIIGAMVLVVQLNKARFVKISVLASCSQLEQTLTSKRANFTYDESKRMKALLTTIARRANAEKKLDVQLGGHYLFILKVMEEILQDGQLKPGELEKMEMLVKEAQRLAPGKTRKSEK